MWKAIRSNIGFSLLLLLFIVLTLLFFIGLISSENVFSLKKESEQTVASKFSEKGLYFGPQYFVESKDGVQNRVSKKEIYNLQIDDRYTVYGNKLSAIDLILAGVIFIIGLCLVLFTIYILASTIFHETKLFLLLLHKLKTYENKYKKLGKMMGKIIVFLIVAVMVICLILVGKNTLYKVRPIGKTKVEAEIINRDESVRTSPRFDTKIYTFTLQYEDDAGISYETRKDVSRFTYDSYANEMYIPITYRNNHPFDVFVVAQSFGEFINPIFRIESIIIAVVIYLSYFIIRKYSKEKFLGN